MPDSDSKQSSTSEDNSAYKNKLSASTAHIVKLLCCGLSKSEIISRHPQLSDRDIVLAVQEVLQLHYAYRSRPHRAKKIQERYRRAYCKWSPEEERRLRELYKDGKTMREIASYLQRQPSAIQNRLNKLGFFE